MFRFHIVAAQAFGFALAQVLVQFALARFARHYDVVCAQFHAGCHVVLHLSVCLVALVGEYRYGGVGRIERFLQFAFFGFQSFLQLQQFVVLFGKPLVLFAELFQSLQLLVACFVLRFLLAWSSSLCSWFGFGVPGDFLSFHFLCFFCYI